MKLGTLLLVSYLGILALCFAYPVYLVADRLRVVYLESAEEPLVDTANVLAELVGSDADGEQINVDHLYPLFDRIEARPLDAKIYSIRKQQVTWTCT